MDESTGDKDPVEELVAELLERSREEGPEALRQICERHPARAAAVRSAVAQLQRVGLLPPEVLGECAGPTALQFEHHELLGPLGSGGMGVVYRARDTRTDEIVALKTADPRVPWNDRMRERFRREIEAARRLEHPRLLGIRDLGEHEGLPWYTMRYVEGPTLAALLDTLRAAHRPGSLLQAEDLQAALASLLPEGARPPREGHVEFATRIALEVAEALEHLHGVHVVHRDIKPGNVLIDAEGRANVFDLGLAHIIDDTRLTHTGDFAGSPQYAAPEQVAARGEISPGTDVYGVGATLFELLTLQPPFAGGNTPELMRRIAREEAPPLRSLLPDAPRDLETLCQCCLEKLPGQRYASSRELAEDLAALRRLEPVRARAVGRVLRALRFARRNPAPATAAGLGLAIVIGAPLALLVHTRTLAGERDLAREAALEARREATENREVSSFLESLILDLNKSPRLANREAAREIIEQAHRRVAQSDSLTPLTRAGLFETVARVLVGVDREQDAIALLDRSLSLRQTELGASHAETLSALHQLADLHLGRGDLQSADGLVQRGLRQAGEAPGMPRVRLLMSAAAIASSAGQPERAAEQLTQALEVLDQVDADARPGERARILGHLGRARAELGDAAAAAEHLEEALGLAARAWHPDLRAMAAARETLGQLRLDQGSPAAAASHLQIALELLAKDGQVVGPDARRLLGALVDLPAPEDPARRLEQLVLLGRNQLDRGEPSGATFEAALELAESAGLAAPELLLHAHVGAANAALADRDDASLGTQLDAALRLAAAPGIDPGLLGELAQLRLRQIQRTPAGPEREALLAGELERTRSADEARLDPQRSATLAQIDQLRERALLLLDLGSHERAAQLLEGARAFELLLETRSLQRIGLELDTPARRAYLAAMQQGITGLQSERFTDAVAAFELGAELDPRDPTALYNQACAHASLGNLDAALGALGRSVERGYAYRERALELVRTDSDLRPLRDDPRFAALLAEMDRRIVAADEFSAAPALHVPSVLESVTTAPGAGPPLLLVLHADGETHRDLIAGPWAQVADELDALLLAPSGRIPTGAEPADGMAWTDGPQRYASRSNYYEEPVGRALAWLRARREFDAGRVWIAGEGLGGTLALHLALDSPELFRGCLLIDSAVPLELLRDRTPQVAGLDRRVLLAVDTGRRAPAAPGELSPSDYAEQMLDELSGWGLRTRVRLRTRGGELDADELRAWLGFLGL